MKIRLKGHRFDTVLGSVHNAADDDYHEAHSGFELFDSPKAIKGQSQLSYFRVAFVLYDEFGVGMKPDF
ncbi:hypothetical protein C0J45_9228 [Silurus meridionalis]|nr:hypothetical protein C0J45_9228 [Silurus meridionalis]